MHKHMKEDFDDFDEDLSPELNAQLERFEKSHNLRAQDQLYMRRQKLKLRRQLEDWSDSRRMRDELDYLH